jgi:hypothetical protein
VRENGILVPNGKRGGIRLQWGIVRYEPIACRDNPDPQIKRGIIYRVFYGTDYLPVVTGIEFTCVDQFPLPFLQTIDPSRAEILQSLIGRKGTEPQFRKNFPTLPLGTGHKKINYVDHRNI